MNWEARLDAEVTIKSVIGAIVETSADGKGQVKRVLNGKDVPAETGKGPFQSRSAF